MGGPLESDYTCPGKGSVKTLSLQLRLILGTETVYNNQSIKKKQTTQIITKNKANLGEGGEINLQYYHIIRFKCPVFNRKSKGKNYHTFRGKKKIDKPIVTVPKKI